MRREQGAVRGEARRDREGKAQGPREPETGSKIIFNRLRASISDLRWSITRNPIAWLLFGALLWCVWGNYEKGRDLDRLCELTGPHDVGLPAEYAKTARDKIDNICISHQPLDPLE